MHRLLFEILPWMSGVAHWVHDFVYDWPTFIVVLAIGLAQIFLAVHSGKLAVASLAETVPARAKHMRVFISLGIVLFGLTAIAGKLNDNSQKETENRSNTISRKLDSYTTYSQQAIEHFWTYSSLIDLSKYTPQKAAQIVQEGAQVQRNLSQAATTVNTFSNPTAPTVPDSLPKIPAQTQQGAVPAPDSSSYTSLQSRLQALRDRVDSLDKYTLQQTSSIWRQWYMSRGMSNAPLSSESEIARRITLIDQQRDDMFSQQILPQARTIRDEVIHRLQLSDSQQAAEVVQFDSIVKAIPTVEPDATTVNDALKDNVTLRYSGLTRYLNDLSERLKTAQSR